MSFPFQLAEVSRVLAYKRDELTTDLICLEITTPEGTWLFHEEQPVFGELEAQLATLTGFDTDWRQKVVLPAFDRCETIIYLRSR